MRAQRWWYVRVGVALVRDVLLAAYLLECHTLDVPRILPRSFFPGDAPEKTSKSEPAEVLRNRIDQARALIYRVGGNVPARGLAALERNVYNADTLQSGAARQELCTATRNLAQSLHSKSTKPSKLKHPTQTSRERNRQLRQEVGENFQALARDVDALRMRNPLAHGPLGSFRNAQEVKMVQFTRLGTNPVRHFSGPNDVLGTSGLHDCVALAFLWDFDAGYYRQGAMVHLDGGDCESPEPRALLEQIQTASHGSDDLQAVAAFGDLHRPGNASTEGNMHRILDNFEGFPPLNAWYIFFAGDRTVPGDPATFGIRADGTFGKFQDD